MTYITGHFIFKKKKSSKQLKQWKTLCKENIVQKKLNTVYGVDASVRTTDKELFIYFNDVQPGYKSVKNC